jgi:hypothetical protein
MELPICGVVSPGGAKLNKRLFMPNARALPTAVLTYLGVIGLLVVCAFLGIAMVVKASTAISQRTDRERTLLDLRLESAREIQQALAKPLPPVEPLPVITRKAVARTEETNTAKLTGEKLPRRGHNAFASGVFSSQHAPSALSFDRHSSNF